MTKHFVVRAIFVLGLLAIAVLLPEVALAQNNAASITSARQQLIACYDSARQAEAAGANISSLTSVLNDAGDLLSRAELAYSQGDSSAAQSLVSQVGQRLSNVISDADALRDAALQQQNYEFWVEFVGSIVATFVVIAAGFGVWQLLKRRYKASQVETEAHVDEPSGD